MVHDGNKLLAFSTVRESDDAITLTTFCQLALAAGLRSLPNPTGTIAGTDVEAPGPNGYDSLLLQLHSGRTLMEVPTSSVSVVKECERLPAHTPGFFVLPPAGAFHRLCGSLIRSARMHFTSPFDDVSELWPYWSRKRGCRIAMFLSNTQSFIPLPMSMVNGSRGVDMDLSKFQQFSYGSGHSSTSSLLDAIAELSAYSDVFCESDALFTLLEEEGPPPSFLRSGEMLVHHASPWWSIL